MSAILGLLGAAILVLATYACVWWMDRAHKRLMHEMQERHEQRMAEWRALFAQAEPPADG